MYTLIAILLIAGDGSQAGGIGPSIQFERNLTLEECTTLKNEFLTAPELLFVEEDIRPTSAWDVTISRKAKCVKM